MGNLWVDRAAMRMQELGFTQDALASRIGCTRSCVNHYFSGYRTPPLDVFQEMADALECTPAWLQFGAGKVSPVHTAKSEKNVSDSISLYSWKEGIIWLKQLHLPNEQKSKKTRSKKIRLAKKSQKCLPFFRKDPKRKCIAITFSEAALRPSCNKNIFHKKDILLIEPQRRPKINQWVVAQFKRTGTISLKRFTNPHEITVLGTLVTLIRTEPE